MLYILIIHYYNYWLHSVEFHTFAEQVNDSLFEHAHTHTYMQSYLLSGRSYKKKNKISRVQVGVGLS